MFCVKCGKEVKEGTKFCTNCGAEMEAKEEVKEEKLSYSQNSTIATATNPAPVAAPASTGDGKGTASLVLGIVSFVVPCVGFITSIVGLILGICAKKSGKKTAGIILNAIALGLIIIGTIAIYALGYVSEWTGTTTGTGTPTIVTPSTNNHKTNSTGTFRFGDFDITVGNNYTFTTITNQSSQYYGKDVIKLPVTLKNVTSTDNDHLNMYYHEYYGPSGKELPKLGTYFYSDSVDYIYVDAGESVTRYFYLLYDGDGKYRIEFDNYKEEKTVEFTIKK